MSIFYNRYRSVSRIIQKHYKILLLDQWLVPAPLAAPQITLRKACTVKNILAPSKKQVPNKRAPLDIRPYFENRIGIFQWKKRGCLTSQFITHGLTNITTKATNEPVFHAGSWVSISPALPSYFAHPPDTLGSSDFQLRALVNWSADLFPHSAHTRQHHQAFPGLPLSTHHPVVRGNTSLHTLLNIQPIEHCPPTSPLWYMWYNISICFLVSCTGSGYFHTN